MECLFKNVLLVTGSLKIFFFLIYINNLPDNEVFGTAAFAVDIAPYCL